MFNNKLNASLVALVAILVAPFAANAGEVFVDNYDYTDFSNTTVELDTSTYTETTEDYNRAFGASASKVYYDGDITTEYDTYSYGYSYGNLTGLQLGGSFNGSGYVYDGQDTERAVDGAWRYYGNGQWSRGLQGGDGGDGIIDQGYVGGEYRNIYSSPDYYNANNTDGYDNFVTFGAQDYATDYQYLNGGVSLGQRGAANINLSNVSFGNSTATTSYDDYTVHTADAWELGTEFIDTITVTETDGTIVTESGKEGSGHRTSAGTK